jgi:methyl acetate hydrolase
MGRAALTGRMNWQALCTWAGLANLFYWIDRQNGFGGFWATQILPFGDPASFAGYMDFETAFYKNLRRRQTA